MGFTAFNYGANAIAFEKENRKYAMTCAWAMQVDYDKILCLLGSQSASGKAIKKGDIIGVSALSSLQESIAFKLGENHSDEVNKLEGIDYSFDGSAILIDGCSKAMKVEVIDVLHLEGIEEDNLVYGKVIKSIENNLPLYQFNK